MNSFNSFDAFYLKRAVVDVARGNLVEASSACAQLAAGWWKNEVQYDLVSNTFCPLVAANDRPALVRLLHEWEAHTVEQLGIRHLWVPTPFPLELQAPAS